jgi:transcriptional regulator with GAF, ATPase, and Fis domain
VEEQQQEVEPDPLNADTLLKHFNSSNLSKSVAPVALCVEECSAMLNAQTRMRTTINELAHQLKEMKEMGTELMREQDRTHHNEDITELEKKISEKRKDLEKMEKSYPERRDNAISQYRPLLNQSVFRFNAAYAKLRKDEKQCIEVYAPAITEDALEYMKVRCKEVNKLKVDMVQPSGAGADDALNTLLALIHKAEKAVPVLKEVMDAVKTHVEKTCPDAKGKVTLEGPSIKGVPRCCAKVAEEYAGNYRKLCDLVRCTLVFPSVHASAHHGALTSPHRCVAPLSFRPCTRWLSP